jgi:hypothetical protein
MVIYELTPDECRAIISGKNLAHRHSREPVSVLIRVAFAVA